MTVTPGVYVTHNALQLCMGGSDVHKTPPKIEKEKMKKLSKVSFSINTYCNANNIPVYTEYTYIFSYFQLTS